MSAVSPEFYNFLHKLEDNSDRVLPSRSQQPLEFEFDNSTCHICNGYYGPNFGEPVCVTCHAFLFPDYPIFSSCSYYNSEKTDDGDSGNDEPSDLSYMIDRRNNRFCPYPSWFYCRNSMDNEVSPEDEANQVNNSGEEASGSIKNNETPNPDHSVELSVGQAPPLPTPSVSASLQVLSTPRLPDNLQPGIVEELPSEVLLCIFSYLDDLSLCTAGAVCTRWAELVEARVSAARWATFAALRWPLYQPARTDVSWQKKYQALVEASFCRNCLVQMCTQTQPIGEESHWRRNRLRIELKMLRNDPPEGIAATPLDPKCCHWQASVTGPAGSPYEGGLFYLYIQVPYTYPMNPPVVRFLTRILHPNVSRHGDVGIDSVHHNWTLALTISKVLISIQSLLTDPYTKVCMEPELGAMYVNDRSRFEALARRWTWRYAMLDVLL